MSVRERIEAVVSENHVVLFMKGTRHAPQCGFSATAVDILDDYLDDYHTVDVLADPAVREGIKGYSEWPTIPQLYVDGRFVGGSDILKEMRQGEELGELLGAPPKPFVTPEITVAERALGALLDYWDKEGEKPCVRLEVDAQYRTGLSFDVPRDDDLVLDSGPLTLLVDRSTARRADGVSIDWLDAEGGPGFKIDNPNEPPRVRRLTAAELRRFKDDGKPIELFDVRAAEERSKRDIEGSILLDTVGKERLSGLDRDTPVVLFDDRGDRSHAAAEHCLRMGFSEVYYLEGGVDAWTAHTANEP